MIEHAVAVGLGAQLGPVIVVVDPAERSLVSLLGTLGVQVVENPSAARGMGSSIRCAIASIDQCRQIAGAIVLLCDQPKVTPLVLQALAGRLEVAPVSACRYAEGTVGPPAAFARSVFPELLAIPDSEGAKRVLGKHRLTLQVLDCPAAGEDVDLEADVRGLT